MHVVAALRALPRPTWPWLAPQVALLGVFLLAPAPSVGPLGVAVFPLKWAFLASFAAAFAFNAADIRRRLSAMPVVRRHGLALLLVALWAFVMAAPNPATLQVLFTIIIGLTALAGSALTLISEDDGLERIEGTLTHDPDWARLAAWVTGGRLALVCLISSLLITSASVAAWVLFITLGRSVLAYGAEWALQIYVRLVPRG